jgi:hypothetical protein
MIRAQRSAPFLPTRSRGHQTPESQAVYERQLNRFCAKIIQIASRLDFKMGGRGWCYFLESEGLLKGDFGKAQNLINDCRKSGKLPIDICADDDKRSADFIEHLDTDDIHDEAQYALSYIQTYHATYHPTSFWDGLPVYLEVAVEKADLKSLFASVCGPLHVPLWNAGGWGDLNSRAATMRRFRDHEAEGRKCILLYCGDHDPGGLHISDFIKKNLQDLSAAVGWSPDNLTVDRFGLNYDFIEANGLTWIENLHTASGKHGLDDKSHHDHNKEYVSSYLKKFGARKCEANALVVRPEEGRELCREAIFRYLPKRALRQFQSREHLAQAKLQEAVARAFTNAYGTFDS